MSDSSREDQPVRPTEDDYSNTPPLGTLPLAREDVDRGCEVRAREGYLQQLWTDENTRVLWLYGGQAPVFRGDLVLDRVPQGRALPEDAVYLGRSTEHAGDGESESVELILLIQPSEEDVPELSAPETGRSGLLREDEEPTWMGVMEVAAALDDRDAGIFVEAVAVANWHRKTRFCSQCGAKLKNAQSGWVKVCTREGTEHFPRTDPAVIVAIIDDQDRVLLGSNAAWSEKAYSTIAGFVEPGESLEAAVIRETYEEARVIVDQPRYMGSQPWPFPQSLMLGFFARARNPEEVGVGDAELRHVAWFSKEELRAKVRAGEMMLPGSASIARSLLTHWYGGPLPEPVLLESN